MVNSGISRIDGINHIDGISRIDTHITETEDKTMKRSIQTIKKDFIKIARMTQPELKTHLQDALKAHGYVVII